jgi:hypothetical protein
MVHITVTAVSRTRLDSNFTALQVGDQPEPSKGNITCLLRLFSALDESSTDDGIIKIELLASSD